MRIFFSYQQRPLGLCDFPDWEKEYNQLIKELWVYFPIELRDRDFPDPDAQEHSFYIDVNLEENLFRRVFYMSPIYSPTRFKPGTTLGDYFKRLTQALALFGNGAVINQSAFGGPPYIDRWETMSPLQKIAIENYTAWQTAWYLKQNEIRAQKDYDHLQQVAASRGYKLVKLEENGS